MSYTVVNRDTLPFDGDTYELVGRDQGDLGLSVLWVDMEPGHQVKLHKHPYKEIFVIEEGVATYRVGTETLEAHAGQIIILEADMPHGFTNTGSGRLKQVDIHVSHKYITEWLED